MIVWYLSFAAVVALIFITWWLLKRKSGTPTPFADFPVHTAEVGPWKIRYHQSGHGPVLVLLHGIGANLYCWRRMIPILQSRYTIVAPDLPGFGGSSKIAGEKYGLEEQVERLQAFLNQLSYKKIFIVGNSMGGNIALWYALTHPDQVRGCAVIAPATSGSLIPLDATSLQWLAHPISYFLSRPAMRWAHHRTVTKRHLVDQDRVEETFRTYGRDKTAVGNFLAATASIRDPRLAARLKEMRKHVLILWGSADRVVPRKVIEAAEAALALKTTFIHEGGGHHLQEDEPEWVAEKIDGFFSTGLD